MRVHCKTPFGAANVRFERGDLQARPEAILATVLSQRTVRAPEAEIMFKFVVRRPTYTTVTTSSLSSGVRPLERASKV